ncbi:MAG: hypothetical protein GX061_02855 [Eubacteriaceae bacterium]|nr:hypothetical protein [Eubacteriaceae bacterium]
MKRKKKKKLLLSLKIVLVVLCATAVFAAAMVMLGGEGTLNGNSFKKTTLNKLEKEFEYNSKATLYDLFDLENGTLVSADMPIDTGKLGEATVKIVYKNSRGKSIEEELTYTVTDKTPPVIICGEKYTLTVNNNIDFTQSVISGDVCDPSPKREIIGSYDVNTLGEYPLTYRVSDASGNVSSHDFTLRVVPASNSSGGSTPYYHFADFVSDYKGENRLYGIDVSTWQGDIDWYKVKSSGVSFAIMRIGYQAGWGGDPKMDGWYLSNIEEAKKAGIDYLGVYFYSYASTLQEAETQAEWVVRNLKGVSLELGVALDWEDFSRFNSMNKSFKDMNDIARAFFGVIEENGYKGMNYGSLNYMRNIWDLPEYDTWLAHYAQQTTYEKDYLIWQRCSNGKVEGINGYCDLDIMYINH